MMVPYHSYSKPPFSSFRAEACKVSLPTRLLWVNRDTRHGPPTGQSAINRHAQLKTNPKRRKRRSTDLLSAAQRIAVESWNVAPTDTKRKDFDKGDAAQIVQQKSLPLANYGINASAPDPFDSSVIKLDYSTVRSLQYHLTYSLSAGFRNEALARGGLDETHRYFSILECVVQDCMSNEMHMSALLSAVNARMLLNKPEDEQLERRANMVMQQGIVQLRRYFLNYENDTTIDLKVILSVFHLACGEWYRRSLPAAITHLRILRHFMNILDLSRPYDHYLFDLIHFHDVFIALEGGTVPIFPLSWEPTDPPYDQLSIIKEELDNLISTPRQRVIWRRSNAITAEDNLLHASPFALIQQHPDHIYAEILGRDEHGSEQRPGRSFLTALSQNVFSPPFVRIVRDYLVRVEVATHAHLGGKPSAEHVEWMNKRLVATLHKLAAARPQTHDGRLLSLESVKRKIEECFRLATITYLAFIAAPLPWRIGEASMLRLQRAVRLLPADTFSSLMYVGGMEILDRMLIWALINGIFGAATREAEAEWFTARAAVVARRLGLSGYTQLHRLMGEFTHPDSLHYEALRRLVKKMDMQTHEHAATTPVTDRV